MSFNDPSFYEEIDRIKVSERNLCTILQTDTFLYISVNIYMKFYQPIFQRGTLYLFSTVLCDWLHIPLFLAKSIGITEIAHFSLNYSVYALKKSDGLSFLFNNFNFLIFFLCSSGYDFNIVFICISILFMVVSVWMIHLWFISYYIFIYIYLFILIIARPAQLCFTMFSPSIQARKKTIALQIDAYLCFSLYI